MTYKTSILKMQNSTIGWTDFTHNFWTGCQKVSQGCKFCYMWRIYESQGRNPKVVMRNEKGFYAPTGKFNPLMIFTNSMSDFFIKEADQWRAEAWKVIKETPWHTWQILTKRPERIAQCLPGDWENGYPNVWLGVSVEDQGSFHRVKTLSKIPASLRFISAEPLLEEVDLLVKSEDGSRPIDSISWVITGGETGYDFGNYRYRECKLAWLYRIVKDIKEQTNAAVFVKQLGTFLARKHQILGNKADDIATFPKYLQVQEIPDLQRKVVML